jgi:hypothetical protein
MYPSSVGGFHAHLEVEAIFLQKHQRRCSISPSTGVIGYCGVSLIAIGAHHNPCRVVVIFTTSGHQYQELSGGRKFY